MHNLLYRALLTLLVVLAPNPQYAQDEPAWPQWRGPRSSGVSLETEWDSTGRSEPLWTSEVGLGYSSSAVVDGRLYTKGFDRDAQLDVVSCLDTRTGKVLWDFTYEARATPSAAFDEGHAGGTNSTPSVGGGFVYTLAREGSLHCFEAVHGRLRWEQNYVREYELELPTWGFAASPLVLHDALIVNQGKVLALDPETGEVRWTSKNYGHSYSTPAAFEFAGVPALAVFNSHGLAVLDRTDGTEVAFRGWRTRYDINAASPLVIGDCIYISSGQGRGNALLKLTDQGLETLWENKHMGNKMSGCVLIDDHLYGFHETLLRCIDLDGEVRWTHRGLGYGALMGAGDRLILLDDSGHLLVAKANPERFELLSEAKVLEGGVCWTRPLLIDGRIYCRNNLGSLVCRDHRVESAEDR